MSNIPITMLKIKRIIQLKIEGHSNREIAKSLKLSKNTVNDYVKELRRTGQSFDELLGLDDAALSAVAYPVSYRKPNDSRYDVFMREVGDWVSRINNNKRTHETRRLLWEDYISKNPDGYSYSQYCDLLRQHLRVSNVVMHLDHMPGYEMMFDFAGDPLSYTDPDTGEIVRCPVLVCVLPYSGYTYVEALPSMQRKHLVGSLCRCLEYYGGVPSSAKTDNMKQIVKKSDRYEPSFDEFAEQWSTHYITTLQATRVCKPRDKASVESAVNTVYNRIYGSLSGQRFHSLFGLNAAIMQLLDILNKSPFQKRNYSRYDRFISEEKELLKPLPERAFSIIHTAKGKVKMDYHVTLGEEWNFYSVPYQYVGKQVDLIYDTDHVQIYYNRERIATHVRSYRKNSYSTLREHMPAEHRNWSEQQGWDQDYFLRKAADIGCHTHKAINHILSQRTFVQQSFNACKGILRLANIHGPDRVEKACERALHGSRVNYKILENILKDGLDKVGIKPIAEPPIPFHDNIRGPQAYQ